MIELREARRLAEARLQEIESGGTLKLKLTGEQEFADGWIFLYDSVQHLETGAVTDSLAGNAPILVDRESGEIYPTGTAQPVEHYIREFSDLKRRQREGWPDDLDARFRYLLRLVSEGQGRRDARALDIYMNTKFPPRPNHHVTEELLELEHRGLVNRRPDSDQGLGNRWEITAMGLDALKAQST